MIFGVLGTKIVSYLKLTPFARANIYKTIPLNKPFKDKLLSFIILMNIIKLTY